MRLGRGGQRARDDVVGNEGTCRSRPCIYRRIRSVARPQSIAGSSVFPSARESRPVKSPMSVRLKICRAAEETRLQPRWPRDDGRHVTIQGPKSLSLSLARSPCVALVLVLIGTGRLNTCTSEFILQALSAGASPNLAAPLCPSLLALDANGFVDLPTTPQTSHVGS